MLEADSMTLTHTLPCWRLLPESSCNFAVLSIYQLTELQRDMGYSWFMKQDGSC